MIADRVITSYWFYKTAAIASKIYIRLLIWPRVMFRKMQSYRHNQFRPDISDHGRDITTSGLRKRPPSWNSSSGLDFDFSTAISMWFCTAYQILCKSDDRRRSYDVILILQDGGHSKSTSGFWFGYAWNLWRSRATAHQISTRYINPRMRIYYVRFLKKNGLHLEILFPVSILTLLLPLACGFPSAYQISSTLDYLRQSYDVIAIFKMAAVSHVGLL